MEKGVYAFDECSLLHLCEIKVPIAFQALFPQKTLKHRNCQKLSGIVARMQKEGVGKYRFTPSNIDRAIIKVGNGLIIGTGVSVGFLPHTFKAEVTIQLDEFLSFLSIHFDEIPRIKDIGAIKALFQSNLQSLRKKPDLPEDEDFEILAGYRAFSSQRKHLITEDEHFWGYSPLISSHLGIFVVKEWECHTI